MANKPLVVMMDNDLGAKKSLGQHWLHDKDILSNIVGLAEVSPGDLVVEIGPGLGTLTGYLLDRGADVIAVELDQKLYQKLSSEKAKLFGSNAEKLNLVNQDILTFRFDQLTYGYKVVANIPYYLTSNLIRVLSESSNSPAAAVLLIQKEVAERLCASPGSMSLLSVWAQMYFKCELGPIVPAKLFTPPPKVDSRVVVMKRKSTPVFKSTDKKLLTRMVKAGFSNKRKTLHNSLASGLQISKPQAARLLESVGISNQARPQELTLQNWVDLADYFQKLNH